MNEKELINLEHYRQLIENRKFDEYDIIGFLILVRQYLSLEKNPIFFEVANGIAHRERNQGKIYDSIYFSISNNYLIDNNGHVQGYNGVQDEKWKKECKSISEQFDIKITPIISIELAICIFSILHRSNYITDDRSNNKLIKIKGSIEIITKDDNVSLVTSDDKNKRCICFMKIKNIDIIKKNYFVLTPVETYRKNKFLFLKEKDKDILKVTIRK